MLVSMKVRDLQSALKALRPLCSSKTTLGILAQVHLQAQDDKLTLHATNIAASATVEMPADVISAGETLVPFATIAAIRGAGDVEIDAKAGLARAGGVEYRLGVNEVTEFPAMPVMPADAQPCPQMPAALLATAHALGEDASRPYLRGYCLRGGEVLTTDGMRVATYPIDLALKRDLIVEAGDSRLPKLAGHLDAESCVVAWDEHRFHLYDGRLHVVTRLIDAQYPDVRRLLPTSYGAGRFSVAPVAWKALAKGLPKHNTYRINVPDGADHVLLTASTLVGADRRHSGHYEEVANVNAPTVGETACPDKVTITVDAKFIKQAIEAADADVVDVEIADNRSPVRLACGALQEYILPMISW